MGTAGDNKRDTKQPRPEEFRRENEEFLRKVLASAHDAITHRASSGVFGELTIKISQQGGRITGAKVVEETVLKPGDT